MTDLVPTAIPAPEAPSLSDCAREPIHIPGAVQAHGTLLVLAEPDLTVTHAAANLARYLGVPLEEVLGFPLERSCPAGAAALRAALAEEARGIGPAVRFDFEPPAGRPVLEARFHRHDGRALLELEPPGEDAPGGAGPPDLAGFIEYLEGCATRYDIARRTADLVSRSTGFDRVMVYRFLPDWSGDVIAEVRHATEPAYLGLHFPASDIPLQARELYRVNLLRSIADVRGEVVPLVADPTGRDVARPVDLGRSNLRAVSPIHLEYLRNMGVGATLVASLMVGGRLWGLIACHHATGRRCGAGTRDLLSRIALIAAGALERSIAADIAQARRRTEARLAALDGVFDSGRDSVAALLCGDRGLRDLGMADGVALYVDGAVAAFGRTPDTHEIRHLVERHGTSAPGGTCGAVVATDCLDELEPQASAFDETVAGMLMVELAARPRLVALAFRREVIQEIFWGGDPQKPASAEDGRLSPRKSFERWRQTVTGRCPPWSPEVVDGWGELPARLVAAAGGADRLADRLVGDIRRFHTWTRFDEPAVHGLIDVLPGAVLVARRAAGDSVFHAFTMNREFRRIFDIVPDEVAGRRIDDVLSLLGVPPAIRAMIPGASAETTLMASAAGERTVSISRRSLLKVDTEDDGTALSAWVFQDITSHRRTEEALRTARDQALVASRSKSAFLANMSHELRTPLNAIIGFSELLADELFGPLGDAKYKEYVNDIRHAGEHLLSLISDLLDISKIEAGRRTINEDLIDLGSLVARCCSMISDLARRGDVQLEWHIPATAPNLHADARAVRQIVVNLLSNAVKFTPAGGTVTCRTLALQDGGVAIEVQDTGIGIAEEHLDRVLEPFYQVDNSLTRQVGGTGLGLSLVNAIANLHQGRLVLESKVGCGTTARVEFPPWRTVPAQDGHSRAGLAVQAAPAA
ncbi:GAF domain-containing protein [Skermanella mucosa]|uniref:ATP-binding protein n=1 Tax=Skermanella mucosa TaxID=1789672 RepID=UPI00192AF5A6|nr:ATP-binding protein [Skermanella mucosa]UEM21568.1 GAF domain-containing protein [Skermanella mucosa]